MAEKIVALIDDPARSDEMGRYGRARVETELSWDHQVPALIAAYQHARGRRA
jgi:glycosyltransferase involved in cell wall biosynthesis